MNVLVIGAGRMGIRHATGALSAPNVQEVCIIDVSEDALINAKETLSSITHNATLQFEKIDAAKRKKYETVIVATPALQRENVCCLALEFHPDYLLVEKPLGQSYEEVLSLDSFLKETKVNCVVNLNMRLYNFVSVLKHDLKSLPQFSGPININFSGGSLGIGANGIHYLDLLFHLFDAERAELIAGEIEDTTIPSGRGPQYCDFGGWACINFYNKDKGYLGRSLIELSSTSTVFGGWEIIGTHGRIRLNELEGQRVDILRKPDSTLPINRYAGDYLAPKVISIESPMLSEVTKNWIISLNQGERLLPTLTESIKVHKLLFDWLALSKKYTKHFPIT